MADGARALVANRRNGSHDETVADMGHSLVSCAVARTVSYTNGSPIPQPDHQGPPALDGLPNEILFHILEFLDVNDVLSTSRVSFE